MALGGVTRWPMWRRLFGDKAERAAAVFLRNAGYQIVARNVRLHCGEIDIVAVQGDVIIIVEVRSTECGDVSRPAQSVDYIKQKKLSELALVFLQTHHLLGRTCRFDIVALSWPPGTKDPVIQHFVNAFESIGRFQMFS